MRSIKLIIVMGLMAAVLLPDLALAGGDKASELIVVADTRVIKETDYYHAFMHYLADAYNSNILVFPQMATWLPSMM